MPFLASQEVTTPQLTRPVAVQSISPTESERPASDHGYDALFDWALSSQRKGDYQKAIDYYTKAIELNSQIADAYINRSAAYESTGDLDLALQDLDTALALEPKPEAYNNRGNVYFTQNDYDRAVQDYEKALELEPDNTGAHIYRGHAFKNLALYDHAIREYNEALALNPSNANAHTSIGIVHSLRGDHDDAIEHYEQALKLDSGDPFIYLNRGASYNAKGDYDSAEKDFSKALALHPNHAYAYAYAYAYGTRSLVFIRRGDFGPRTPGFR